LKFEPVKATAEIVLAISKKDEGLDIEINSTVPVAAGLGSSAAVAAAVAAATATLLDVGISKEEIFKIHNRLGEATVPDIVQEVRKSTNPWVCMKVTFAYPNRPARLGTLVSMVLKEAGAKSRKAGDKILFSPVRR
jgi:hypothetical protein